MKKLIFGIFISLGAIFLMSHNASAANLSYNLNDYDWITSVNLGTQYCAYSYNSFGSSPSICVLNSSRPNMFGIRSYDIPHEKGDLAEFYIGVQDNIRGSGITYNFGFFMDNFGAINDNYKIISVEKVIGTVYYDQNTNNTTLLCDSGTDHFMQCSQSQDLPLNDVNANLYADVYKVSILFTTKGSHPVGLTALNSNTPIGTCKINNLPGNLNAGAQCQVRIFGFTQWGYKGSSVNKEQADATQEAADNSESSGNSSQSDSQGATSNLLSVFTGFANVITNASATNCVINAPLNTNFGSQRLNVDLCGLSLPPAIGALTSIIAVMVVVPFAISMFNKFIGIMQGFQR